MLTDQDKNQIVAALRVFQAVRASGGSFVEMNGEWLNIDRMDHFNNWPQMTDDEIDELVDRLYGETKSGYPVKQSWTVVGFYDDTRQAYCDSFEAYEAYEAMAQANGGVTLVGAFPGQHKMTAPCDDSGCIANVEDMPEYKDHSNDAY
jgi:hypothetical protein